VDLNNECEAIKCEIGFVEGKMKIAVKRFIIVKGEGKNGR
jgi:hypothetical protein